MKQVPLNEIAPQIKEGTLKTKHMKQVSLNEITPQMKEGTETHEAVCVEYIYFNTHRDTGKNRNFHVEWAPCGRAARYHAQRAREQARAARNSPVGITEQCSISFNECPVCI